MRDQGDDGAGDPLRLHRFDPENVPRHEIIRTRAPAPAPLPITRRGHAMASRLRLARSRCRMRSILCPVDFSANSRAALRYAATLVRHGDGRVVVLYVDDPLLAVAAATRPDARAVRAAGAR